MLFTKYSELTQNQINEISLVINPYNACTLPTIVNCWLNKSGTSIVSVQKNYLVAYIDYEEEPFWTVSSRDALQLDVLATIAQEIKEYDPGFDGVFRYLSEETVAHIIQNPDAATRVSPEGIEHYPYIYDLKACSELVGSKYSDIRRGLKLFEQAAPSTALKYSDNLDESGLNIEVVTDFFKAWQGFNTEGSQFKSDEELEVTKQLLAYKPGAMYQKLHIFTLYNNEQLVGISICEIIDNSYALNHFHKATLTIPYASMYLFFEVAKKLYSMGIPELNYQDDYDIVGLRQFKNKIRPSKQEKLFALSTS